MNYSKAHQNLSTELQNPEALTNPQDFLGPNCETVLNFWWTMDSLTETQWNEVARRYDALDSAAWDAAWSAARSAAGDAAWSAARSAAGDAAWSAAWSAAGSAAGSAARAAAGYAARAAARAAAGYATYELMGMHTLLNDGKTLLFVPLFNFTKEETEGESQPHRGWELRMPTGEIFNIQEMGHMFISTPTNALGGLQSIMRTQRSDRFIITNGLF
jgi:hypothetical protein